MSDVSAKTGVLQLILRSPKTLAVAAAALIYLFRKLRESVGNTPKGSLGLPLLGETLQFVVNPKAFVEKRKAKYGSIFKTHVLFSPAVYLDGEHVKLLFKNTHIGWPSNWNELLGPYSMAAISGSRHKFQRSVCASAFKREALRSYVPVLQELTMKHLGAWADASKGLRDPEPEIQLYTFEVAEKILLGTSNSKDDLLSILDTFKVWLAAYQGVVPWNVWWTAHGQGMKARATLTKYYQTVIDRKRKNPLPDASDMLTNVMNECDRGEPMTDDELKDFCLVMMFAGHDTTKCTLQTMLHYLSAKPEVAKELEEAVSQVWDGKSPITLEMVEKLQTGKLGRFNDEILRLKSPVAAVYRVAQEDIEYQGLTIPKGWKLMSSPIVQNMQVSPNQDIDLSIDHAKFREDQYSPFGGGSRKCIGYSFAKLELIVWTMCTLKHFDVKVEEGKSAEVNVPFIFIKVRSEFVRKHA